MDFLKNMTNGNNNNISQKQGQNQKNQQGQGSNQQWGGDFLSVLEDKLISTAGGGRESEKNEDMVGNGTYHQNIHVGHCLTKIRELISYKRSSLVKDRKTMSLHLNKWRTKKSRISWRGNIRALLKVIFLSTISPQHLAELLGGSFEEIRYHTSDQEVWMSFCHFDNQYAKPGNPSGVSHHLNR